MKYEEIELAIAEMFGFRQNIIVPNCYITLGTAADHECDLLIIKQSGYACEVEIKVSISDLKADFKKKHNHENELLRELYYAFPTEMYEEAKQYVPEMAGIIIVSKHFNNKISAFISKPAVAKKSRKLTDVEKLRFARLGAMRVWKLKGKLI